LWRAGEVFDYERSKNETAWRDATRRFDLSDALTTTQGGTLSPLPAVQIGGVAATVQFAGLVAPGEFQFNVMIPASLGNGDQSITATYGGASTQSGALITIHN